jgi:hypothetical protein
MSDIDVTGLLGNERHLFDLARSVFPEAGLTPEVFSDILTDAKQSSLPLLAHLGAKGPLSDATRANQKLQSSCEKHKLYKLMAEHARVAPFSAAFVEECQAVRVTLPQSRKNCDAIWTHLGVVKQDDHLIFSVDEVKARYAEVFGGSPPNIARVDLVTGARDLDLARFSPLSIFFAYENEADSVPTFYFLESGNVSGRPEVLYYAPKMGEAIFAQAGFAFTPFACSQNWYTGTLQMNEAGTEPTSVSISIAQEKNGQRHYLTVSVGYEEAEPGPVIFPGAQMIVAVLRVFALGLGLELDRGILGRALGEFSLRHTDWQIAPPKTGEADGYCGCPEGIDGGAP